MPSQEFGLQEVIFALIVTLMEKKALVIIHKTVYYDYYYYIYSCKMATSVTCTR